MTAEIDRKATETPEASTCGVKLQFHNRMHTQGATQAYYAESKAMDDRDNVTY